MLRATQILPAGSWPERPADVVCLDYDRRTRRRLTMVGNGGLSFLLDLAKPPVLASGDGIKLEDGRIVAVEAAPERLLKIACGDARALVRVAWHLGNRHLACEIAEGALYVREDHVIAAMVAGLGAAVCALERPFNPEGGAYAPTHHDHHHDPHGASQAHRDGRP
jgi:urease accessory protein